MEHARYPLLAAEKRAARFQKTFDIQKTPEYEKLFAHIWLFHRFKLAVFGDHEIRISHSPQLVFTVSHGHQFENDLREVMKVRYQPPDGDVKCWYEILKDGKVVFMEYDLDSFMERFVTEISEI
jgi:hypothetical protein